MFNIEKLARRSSALVKGEKGLLPGGHRLRRRQRARGDGPDVPTRWQHVEPAHTISPDVVVHAQPPLDSQPAQETDSRAFPACCHTSS